jgi:hypothetical protein
MCGDAYIQPRNDGRRYEAVLRLSKALSVCTEPQDLTKILSEQLREFLDFLQFYIIVYKEESSEVEWAVTGREKSPMAAYADVPVEQRPSRHAFTRQEPFHIQDWSSDARVPARFKQGIAAQGLDVGPLAVSKWLIRALFFLTKLGTCRWLYSRNSCAFCRNKSSSALAAAARIRSSCAWSPPPYAVFEKCGEDLIQSGLHASRTKRERKIYERT